MRVPIPYYRQWVKSEDSLRELLEGEGLIVLDIVQIDNQRGYGKRYYDVNEADDVFDENINEEAARHLRASKRCSIRPTRFSEKHGVKLLWMEKLKKSIQFSRVLLEKMSNGEAHW